MINVRKLLVESAESKVRLVQNNRLVRDIEIAGRVLISVLKKGKRVFSAGNGGSAADAQHLAAELAGKFISPNRRPLPAVALTTNTSSLTAIGNDFSFDEIFSRQLEGLAEEGDALVAVSTSGNSKNIIEALKTARRKKMASVGLLGCGGGEAKNFCDFPLIVESANTQHIQEAHIVIVHVLCGMIDGVFPIENNP